MMTEGKNISEISEWCLKKLYMEGKAGSHVMEEKNNFSISM